MGFLLAEIHGTTASFLYSALVQIHELPELLLHAISSSCHLCFLLSLSVIWFGQQCNFTKHSQPRGDNNRFLYYNIALFTSMTLVLFHISFCILGYFWYHSNDQLLIVEVGLATRAVTWFVLTAYLLTGFRKSSEDRFPAFLRIWWVVYLILSCSGLLVGILYPTKKEFLSIDQLVFHFCSVFAGIVFNYAGYFGKRVVHETIHGEPLLSGGNVNGFSYASSSLYENASILSILSFSWIGPLLSVGHGKALNLRDVPQLATEDDVRTIFSIFRSILESYARVSPNRTITSWTLAKALILSSWSQLLLGIFCALMAAMASFVGPFLIDYFVQYLSGDLKFANQGYLLVLGFILSKLVEGLCNVQYYFRIRQVGFRLKAPLVAMIYQKGLTLSSCSRQKHTSGEIINYMNIDAPGICSSLWPLVNLLLVPVKVMLALLILYPKIGLASLIALVTTLILMLANIPLAKLQQNYSKKIMDSKDSRMKATSEILRNMRILKLQAWEMKFLSKIMEMRRNETNWLLKSSYSSFAVKFLFSCSSIFVGVVTFGACMLMGITLRTGKVLTALAIFRDLQNPIYSIPSYISELVQTKVSLGRVSAFLCLEDLQPNVVHKLPRGSSEVAIEIKHCNFSWDSSLKNLTLRDLNFSALRGMKVAVCGSVGSGKSSLLSCILGEVPKISGTINLCGKVAYVSQSPWILSGNIQDNITFGNKMDANKYDRVLDVCSLKKDLEAMPFGDQTIIGERGINLSGGQKQRVQIARAIYHDADIYLFDDPFSAVDAHTGSHLFKECLLGLLSEKTVVYVTHQVEFLPSADLILVLEDGRIAESGKYNELLNSGTKFMELVVAHSSALSAHNLIEHTSDASEGGSSMKSSASISRKKELPDEENDESKEVMQKGHGQDEEREIGKVGFWVYWRYIKMAYKGALVPPILLAQILFHGFGIASNYWMAFESPRSDESQPPVSGSTLISVYAALAIGSAACILLRSFFTVISGYKTATMLFSKMHSSIFRAPMSFFDSTPTGRILNRASTDQSRVDTSLPSSVASFASSLIQLLGTIAVMSQVAWLVLIIIVPIVAACIWYQQYYIDTARELSRLKGIRRAPIIQHFAESISGSVSVRSFDKEKEFVNTNYNLTNDVSQLELHSAGATQWLCFRLEMLSTLAFAFSLIFLICLPEGVIDSGIAGVAVKYGLGLNMTQISLIWVMCEVEDQIISVERILQYTSIPSEPPLYIAENRPNHRWPSKGEIEIHDLKVRYGHGMPFILRGFTCTFPGGRKTGVVGRTGSGKSTIIQTIFRILEPTVGHVFIDGIDISTIGLHDLRSRLSIIPQDPVMFKGTVRNNLDPLEECTDEEIWKALDRCRLGEETRKKELSLDSKVTENGENWSVGQRQLVCLARVLLRKSKILVLDEATASVDTITDTVIQKTLRQQFSESTVITVAHRITSVIDSDIVLVLDNGVAVELDNPKKLIENKYSLFSKLASEYATRYI